MTEETQQPDPSRISAVAVLACASLGLAALWWIRENLMEPPTVARGSKDSTPPAARPTTSPKTPAAAPPPKPKPPAATPREATPPGPEPKPDSASATASAPSHDDLTQLEGIGPKIASVLRDQGLDSFAKLAAQTPQELRDLLASISGRYRMFDPETWPEQAALAAAGRLQDLKALQAEFKGGRRS
ncbi:MAG: helix-hairpin-helix domain-containing protein [Acidobacteriota bacterium]